LVVLTLPGIALAHTRCSPPAFASAELLPRSPALPLVAVGAGRMGAGGRALRGCELPPRRRWA